MKNFFAYFLIVSTLAFVACSEEAQQKTTESDTTSTDVAPSADVQTEVAQEKGDAQGEDEKVGRTLATKDEDNGFIRFKANGTTMEATFVASNNTSVSLFQRQKDDSYSAVVMQRGTSDQLREVIGINIINYNPRTLSFPYEIKPEQGKHFHVSYQVKKSGVFIDYFANATKGGDKFKIILTGYENGVLKGTFGGELRNVADKVVILEEGEFEIKLQEQIMGASNPT